MEELIGGIIGKEVMAIASVAYHFKLKNNETILKMYVNLDFHEFIGEEHSKKIIERLSNYPDQILAYIKSTDIKK